MVLADLVHFVVVKSANLYDSNFVQFVYLFSILYPNYSRVKFCVINSKFCVTNYNKLVTNFVKKKFNISNSVDGARCAYIITNVSLCCYYDVHDV